MTNGIENEAEIAEHIDFAVSDDVQIDEYVPEIGAEDAARYREEARSRAAQILKDAGLVNGK